MSRSEESGSRPSPRQGKADIDRMAREHAEAVWADERQAARSRLPGAGLATGDIGAKGDISTRMRELSRRNLRSGQEVPFGTVAPGTGRHIAGGILLLALALAGLLGLLWWVANL